MDKLETDYPCGLKCWLIYCLHYISIIAKRNCKKVICHFKLKGQPINQPNTGF